MPHSSSHSPLFTSTVLVFLTTLVGGVAMAQAPSAAKSSNDASAAPPINEGATPVRAANAATKATRIAVYELDVAGVEPAVAALVLDSLLAELRKLKGVSVIGMNEVRLMLDHETQKQMTGCTDESCLADIAGALGVDELVTGNLAAIGAEHVFGLRRINQLEARVVGTLSKRMEKSDGEEFLVAIGPAVEQLFPDRPLRAEATRGVNKEVALRLNPPPVPAWAFYSAAGTAVGTTALTLVATGVWAISYGLYFDYAAGLSGTQTNYAEISRAQFLPNAALVTALVAGGVSALAAAATGMIFPITNFSAPPDASSTPPASIQGESE